MINLSEIEWGPVDAAEHDDHFLEKYIEPEEISSLLNPNICIIPGEKGSGKTAFCKGLYLKHKDSFHYYVEIKLDRIEFSAIVKSLSELASLTDTDSLLYLCNYWRYVFIIKAIDKYFKENKFNLSIDETKIKNYLLKKGLCERGVTGIMLVLIDKCWSLMSDFTDPNKSRDSKYEIMPSNLEPQILEKVKDYPIFDPEFIDISNRFSTLLKKNNCRIAITLDGLDRINTKAEDKKKKSLQIIFDALIQAVYDLTISKEFKGVLLIKCLLPYDRYISLNLRDIDKISYKTKEIRWSYYSLQNFLSIRIKRHNKCKHLNKFTELWNQIMPDEVHNKFYEINEDSYGYILRHTMYRPRHLQIHLDALSKRYPDSIIDKTMIAKSIRESSKQLAKHYVKEYLVDHPHMDSFLRKLKGEYNVIKFNKFRQIIEEIIKLFNPKLEVENKIDTLYKMSFFGVVEFIGEAHGKIDKEFRYMPPRRHGVKPYKIDFHYLSPKDEITKELDSDDLIAIHPIFFDYCKLEPHPNYIVG